MGNYPTMSEASIKSYLIRGASRNPSLSYPNREFGYGTLDLLQTFLKLREYTEIGLHLTHLNQRAAFLLQIRSCDYHRPNIRIFWYLIHNIQHKFFQDGPQSPRAGPTL